MRSLTYHVLIAITAAGCGEVDKSDGPDDSPSSCAALGAGSLDKNVTLYLDGNPAKAYSAHCAGTDLRTYLPLGGVNTSSYPVGGCSGLAASASASVVTTWQMVRFDPAKHMIDTSDFTFATSTGGTHEVSDNGNFTHDYLRVPFGNGRSCDTPAEQTVAAIDLTGTHFALASAQAWVLNGFSATGGAAINPQRTKATITVSGFPAGVSPCAKDVDYYTLMGGACVTLDYVP